MEVSFIILLCKKFVSNFIYVCVSHWIVFQPHPCPHPCLYWPPCLLWVIVFINVVGMHYNISANLMFHFEHQKVQFIVAECSTLFGFWHWTLLNQCFARWLEPKHDHCRTLVEFSCCLDLCLDRQIATSNLRPFSLWKMVGPCSSWHRKPRDMLHFECSTLSSPQILQESVKADEGEPVSREAFGHNRSKNYTKYDN